MHRLCRLLAIAMFLGCLPKQSAAQEGGFLEGHSAAVYSLATTGDRQVLLSGDVGGTVIAWDWETRSMLDRFDVSEHAVLGLTVSPDRRQFAASLRDGRVVLHDVPLRSAVRQMAATVPGAPTSIALTGDGRFVLTGDQSNYVRMWDAATGQHVRDFSGSGGGVSDVAVMPGDAAVLAGALDGSVRSWNLDSGQVMDVLYTSPVLDVAVTGTDLAGVAAYGEDGLLKLFNWPPAPPQSLQPHSSSVTAIAMSRDRKWILTGGLDQQLHLSRAEDGTYVRTFPTPPGQISTAGISADSALAAAAGPNGVIKFWNLETGSDGGILAGHTGAIHAITFHAKDNKLATAGADGTIRVWTPPAVIDPWSGHDATVLALTVAPNGKRAASAAADKSVRLWNPETGEAERVLAGFEQQVSALAFSPDGTQLACGDTQGNLILKKADDGGDAGRVKACEGSVAGIVWNAEGNGIAVGGGDGQVRIFSTPLTENSEPGVTIEADEVRVYDLAASPSGESIYTAGEDRIVKQWSFAGELKQQFTGYPAAVRHIEVSDDGALIVAAGDPGVSQTHAHVWNTGDGTLVVDVDAGSPVTAVAFAAGESLVVAGADRRVRRFNLSQAVPLESHEIPAAVTALESLPDSRMFLAGAADNRVYPRLLCIERMLTGHEGAVLALEFDGDDLISGGQDGTVRRWDPGKSDAVQTYSGSEAAVNDVAVSEKWIAAAGADAVLRVYKHPATPEERSAPAVEPVAAFTHPAAVRAVSFAGPWVVTGCEDPQVRIWHPEAGEVERLAGHSGQVLSVMGTPDGGVLSGATDNTARRWTPSIVDVQPAASGAGVQLAGSDDGLTLVAVGQDADATSGTVTVWSVDDGNLAGHGAVDGPLPLISAAAVSKDGGRFVLGTAEGELLFYDSKSMTQLAGATAPAGVTSCALTRDGTRLVAGTADNALQFYAIASNDDGVSLERRHDATGHTAAVADLVVGPDDALVATAGTDQTVRFWQSASKEARRVLQKHEGVAYRAAYSPDGTWLITPGSDGVACLWHVATGECVFEHHGDAGAINEAAFHPQGGQFAIADNGGSVLLFDLTTEVDGEAVIPTSETDPGAVKITATRELRPEVPTPLLSVAYSPDGNRVAAGAESGEIHVWLMSDEETPAQILLAHNAPVYAIRFNAAGSRLATIDVGSHLAVWSAGNYSLMAHEQLGLPALFDVAYSADGTMLALSGRDPRVVLHPVPPAGR